MRPALAAVAALALAVAACGSKSEPPPAAGSASSAGSAPVAPSPAPPQARPVAPAPPLTGGAFPTACGEYRETIKRLAQCGTALHPSTRDGLQANFDRQWAGWEKLPEKEKAELAAICKSSSETVKAAATAACGW